MKKSSDVSTIFKPIGRFFQRFHLTIFIVIVASGLAYAVLSLYGVLSDASDTLTTPATTSSTSFDQTTIDRLDKMYSSDNAPAPAKLPDGRTNPFGE
jgi:hypothetical protein